MPYRTPPPQPVHFEEVEIAKIDLGMRFIHRIDDFGCWYVQLRAMVDGKRTYGASKTFYDNKYEGRELALEAAVRFRDEHVWEFFREIDYDPTLRERKKAHALNERQAPKKFRKRKEAATGLMSNIHYIHLRSSPGKKRHSRCVIEVSVNVHGKKYTSTAYSYSFSKYGGKVQSLQIAKKDRNKLAELVHQKAQELNNLPPMPPEEAKRLIKAVKITQAMPKTTFNPDKYIRRSYDNKYWIVNLRKQVNHFDYQVPARRFYDHDYNDKKYRSRIAARQYVNQVMNELIRESDEIRRLNITDHSEIEKIFLEIIEAAAKEMGGSDAAERNGKAK